MTTSTAAPRTLTQMLREWDDKALGTLIRARPDLAFPTPTEFSQVASRATTRSSVSAALDSLTSGELWVAHLACEVDSPFSIDSFVADSGLDEADGSLAADALRHLLALALLWGDETALRPVRAMAATLTVSGEAPAEIPVLTPPDRSDLPTRTTDLVDEVAAGSAFEFVRRVDVLVEHFDHQPAKVTRTGEVSTRDVRALAQLLDVALGDATVLLEIARAASLVGVAARDSDEILLPTPEFDTWQSQPLEEQWALLASSWFGTSTSSGTPELKELGFAIFADPSDGRVVTSTDLRDWLAWHRPRRSATGDRQATLMLDHAAALGITGMGALASYAVPADLPTLAALLPARVDAVVLQADLTAIAPGPLVPEAARELGALADVESRGSATVYRFSVESLRRARAFGWSSDEILATLQARSRTPIPQPLEYLIRDLERTSAGLQGQSTAVSRPYQPPRMDFHAHRPPERAFRRQIADELGPGDRLDDETLLRTVAAVRHGDATPGDTGPLPAYSDNFISVPVDTIREALETGEVIWLGFVDSHGTTAERLVRVTAVDDGVVSATDSASSLPISIPLRRITQAHIIRTGP